MGRRVRRAMVIGTAVAATAAIGGTALAHESSTVGDSFLGDFASHLGVSPAKVREAYQATVIDRIEAAVKAGRLSRAQADRDRGACEVASRRPVRLRRPARRLRPRPVRAPRRVRPPPWAVPPPWPVAAQCRSDVSRHLGRRAPRVARLGQDPGPDREGERQDGVGARGCDDRVVPGPPGRRGEGRPPHEAAGGAVHPGRHRPSGRLRPARVPPPALTPHSEHS